MYNQKVEDNVTLSNASIMSLVDAENSRMLL